MKILGFLMSLLAFNTAQAAPADFTYREVYPGVAPKFEVRAKKYCDKKDPLVIKEFFSEKEYLSAETGKPTPVRNIHIYVEDKPCGSKKIYTKHIVKNLEYPISDKMTHVYLTSSTWKDPDAIWTGQTQSIDDLKKTLSQVKNEKKFSIETALVNLYVTGKITNENKKEAEEFALSNLKTAEKYKKDWNYGNAIHQANTLLGRIKLFEGNIEEAKKYLELAGKTPGSPQLDTFGPNMALAKDLLEKGEKEAVLKYFDACAKFWGSEFSKPEIDSWKKSISENKIPDFGSHLIY